MSQRYWYENNAHWIVVAIGLVFIAVTSWSLFYSKGYQAANQSREAENAAYSTAYQAQQDCVGLGTVDDVRECFARHNHASRAEYRAEQDLNAQREMANWAEGMLWSSWVATVFMGIGIVYVALTLREARETTRAAIDNTKVAAVAADTAREALDHQREQAQLSGRPFIFIEQGAHNFMDWRQGAGPFKWAFALRNYGQNPAIVRSVEACVTLSDLLPSPAISRSRYAVPGDFEVNDPRYFREAFDLETEQILDNLVVTGGDVSPHFERRGWRLMYGDGHPLGDESGALYLATFGVDRFAYYLIVRVRYEDVFGNSFTTNGCWRSVPFNEAKLEGEGEYNRRT